jgi:predicted amidohydrolase
MRAAEALVREAAKGGADFITLPENAFFMREPGSATPPPEFDEAVDHFQGLAQELEK